jgi:hypothetical protein
LAVLEEKKKDLGAAMENPTTAWVLDETKQILTVPKSFFVGGHLAT